MKPSYLTIGRPAWLLAMTAFFGVGDSTPTINAQQSQPGAEAVRVMKVQGNLHMIVGAGGNIAVQIGPDGVVLVDAGSGGMADAVVGAIKRLTDQPIRYIINTGPDVDHIGGNEKLAKAGKSINSTVFDPNLVGNNPAAGGNAGGASIVGPDTLVARMSAPTGSESPFPVIAWPNEPFGRKQKDLYLNREAIQVMYEPAAHSDSDSIVMFRRSDVIVTGDIVDITRFPVIDVDKGGSIQGEIRALNHLLELAVPSIPLPWLDDGGTRLIPGHGRQIEEAELVEYRDMVTVIRDRIQEMINQGMTVDQIKAANPTEGFKRRYGSDSGRSTTNMFIEAIYRSLTAKT